MKQFGIDVSRHNGNFNFIKAKSDGVTFSIIKGGGGDDGLYTDSKFSYNYTAAKTAGLDVGVYWFSKALTVESAKKEAEYFYANCLNGRKFDLPVYIDIENRTQLAVGKRLLTDIIKTWCDYLEKMGFWVGIYSSKSYFDNFIIDSELSCYAHWVAQWSGNCTYNGNFGMWQFGGESNVIRSNKVAGVVCDQNYMLIDYPTLIKANGRNGYKKTASDSQKHVNSPAYKAYSSSSNLVKKWQQAAQKDGFRFPACGADGKWGQECESVAKSAILKKSIFHKNQNLVKFAQTMLDIPSDGIFGSETLHAVISFQKKHNLFADGIIGIDTWKKLLKIG